MNKYYKTAAINGYLAYRNGLHISDCPHPVGIRREGWRHGWNAGAKEQFDRISFPAPQPNKDQPYA